MKNKKDKKNYGGPGKIALVNSITALRFIGSFLVVPVFKALGGVAAAIYSAIFMFTDCIDGSLARKFEASTFFGSMFDGATDKIFILLTFALLMAFNPIVFSIPLLIELGIIIVQKNKMKKGLNVKSNFIGKVKTWVLSASMVASLGAVELLELKPIIEYIKTFSLSKVADIKDLLVLLGINLPGIVLQILTIRSYSKELKNTKVEQEIKEEKSFEELMTYSKEELEEYIAKQSLEDQQLLREYFKEELGEEEKEEVKSPETILNEIAREKEKLQSEYTFLEKAKILGKAMFDPEYYDKNKDRQIRTLTKELFDKKN